MERKVLFTASTFSHILHFHLPYLERFHDLGWTVHIACGGCPVQVPFADRTLALPLEKRMWSPRNFQAARLLRNVMEEERYDLVSTHTSLAAFFTRLAASGLRDRPLTVNMVHGYLFDDKTSFAKRNLLLAAERWTAPGTDLLLTMNQYDRETAERYALGKRVVHIPGVGVDFSRLDSPGPTARQELREEYGISPGGFVLLYPAEFSRRKSQHVLIRAMRDLSEDTVLVLAGEGALLEECQELARRLGVERRVRFPGYVRDMSGWYAAADAAVSASRSEGLPFNVMEAMYAGLPVVASAVKGHTDLIEEGVNGLLYPYGDAQACARQIRRLLDSEELRERLGGTARESAARYSLEEVFPQVWAAYESLLPLPQTAVAVQ